jgi:hypothetical protein
MMAEDMMAGPGLWMEREKMWHRYAVCIRKRVQREVGTQRKDSSDRERRRNE